MSYYNMVKGDGIRHKTCKKLTPLDQKNEMSGKQILNVERALSAHGMMSSTESELESTDSCCEETDSDVYSEDLEVLAPISLLEEFLCKVRKEKWNEAKNLCHLILLYEPQNPEALEFRDVIKEKIQVEKELALSKRVQACVDLLATKCDDSTVCTDDTSTDECETQESSDDDSDQRREHLKSNLIFSDRDDDRCSWNP